MVEDLEVHLENYQRVYFNPNDNIDPANLLPRVTKLMKFFDLCQTNEFAMTLLYIEVPSYFLWKGGQTGWKNREKGTPVEGYPGIVKSEALGRLHTVSPGQEEAFCCRLLLNVVRGPTCFQDLKTVNGVVHATFKGACRARGLLGKG